MENITVAIVSRDKAYNKALSLSLLNVCRSFIIKLYDSRDFVKEWSGYEGRGAFYDTFDIILWAGDEINEAYGDNIVYLTDKPSLIEKDYSNNRFCIYKYSSAKTIVSAVYDIYSHLTGRSDYYIHKDDVRLIGFAAAGGGTGCTTLAMAVGQELSRFRGCRVLYLSFENVESTGSYIAAPAGTKSLPEFLYRLLGGTEDRLLGEPGKIPFLDGYVVRSMFGIEAFAPVRGRNPLPELSCDDIQKFIVALMDSGRYDVILLDLSTCLTKAAMGALSIAERVCLTTVPRQSKVREENYLSQLICCSGERVLDKMIKIENMHAAQTVMREEDISASFAEAEMLPVKGYVSSLPRLQLQSGEIPLEGAFGMDISRLTELLLLPSENV